MGLARCPSILLVVVITNSIVGEELSGPGVDSPPSSIGDREPSSDDDHLDFFAVVDVAIPIDDLEHLGSRITLKSTKVLVHVLSVRKSTLQRESNRLYGYEARCSVDNDDVRSGSCRLCTLCRWASSRGKWLTIQMCHIPNAWEAKETLVRNQKRVKRGQN